MGMYKGRKVNKKVKIRKIESKEEIEGKCTSEGENVGKEMD